jgi:hypothetical protein
MSGGRPPSFNSFTCPNCKALNQVVKVERGPETVDHDVACRSCGAPLPGRKGNFVRKVLHAAKSRTHSKIAARIVTAAMKSHSQTDYR